MINDNDNLLWQLSWNSLQVMSIEWPIGILKEHLLSLWQLSWNSLQNMAIEWPIGILKEHLE